MRYLFLSPYEKMHKGRLHLLDAIRGFTLIEMMLYHFLWDLHYIAGLRIAWYESAPVRLWQKSICFTFLILSGFCFSLGKKPLKRGCLILAFGFLITCVTYLVIPEAVVICGVLTAIGLSMLLLIPIDRLWNRAPHTGAICLAPVLCLLFFFLLYHLPDKRILFFRLPGFLYRNILTAFLGFPPDRFYSADYFPLFPWFFLVLAGYFLHQVFRRFQWFEKDFWQNNPAPFFAGMGRHSLFIYLLHQPVLYALTLLVMNLH